MRIIIGRYFDGGKQERKNGVTFVLSWDGHPYNHTVLGLCLCSRPGSTFSLFSRNVVLWCGFLEISRNTKLNIRTADI